MIALYALLVGLATTVLVAARFAFDLGDRLGRWFEQPLPRARARDIHLRRRDELGRFAGSD